MEELKIRVKEIEVDRRVSVREREEEEIIERYKENLENLPAIIVFHSGDEYILADGFHRLAAAERLGWEYINAEVKEGSYEEACDYAATANLEHGKALTSEEYEKALLRLKDLHPDWTQERMAKTLKRSRTWVSQVLAAKSVEKMSDLTGVDTWIKSEISKAPEELWLDIGRAAKEEGWTVEETREKIKEIKKEPKRAQEIIQPVITVVPEVPADKLIPLTKEIKKLCKIEDEFSKRLDPSVYDWGSGALALHVLQGLYVLAEKTGKRVEKMKKMIEMLEGIGERGEREKKDGGGKREGKQPLEKGLEP